MTPLHFIPGTMCDRRVWEAVWRYLGGGFAPHYIDIEKDPTLAEMRTSIHSASVDGPMHLVGFSMGGYLALEFTLDHPRSVRSLTVICSSAHGLGEVLLKRRKQAIGWLEQHTYAGLPQSSINEAVHPSHRDDPAVVGVMRAMDRDLGQAVLLAQFRETSERASLLHRLKDLRCPVLLVGADTDPYLSCAALAQIAAEIPQAQVALAENAGHMLPLEQPVWLAARIREFQEGLA